MTDLRTAQQKAADAWGNDLPDWVLALALECDRTSQNQAAKAIGYSSAAVSQVINRKWPRDLTSIEQAVRGVLMAEKVACPVVGDLPKDVCQNHQKSTWAPHNPQRIAFYRACRSNCPNSRIGGNDNA